MKITKQEKRMITSFFNYHEKQSQVQTNLFSEGVMRGILFMTYVLNINLKFLRDMKEDSE